MSTGRKLTGNVTAFMDKMGDAKILLDCMGHSMSLPQTRGAWSPCTAFSKQREVLVVIASKALYLFPEERLPGEHIVEIVVHTHCSALDPVCELSLATQIEGFRETRFFSVPSEVLLQEVIMTLKGICPRARLVFHELHWPISSALEFPTTSLVTTATERNSGGSRRRESAGSRAGSEGLSTAGARLLSAPRFNREVSHVNPKLEAFHRRKEVTQRRDAPIEVKNYGAGRYSDAADALGESVEGMISAVDQLMHASGSATMGGVGSALPHGGPSSLNLWNASDEFPALALHRRIAGDVEVPRFELDFVPL